MRGRPQDSTRSSVLIGAAGLFVVLTAIAMLAYPGGARYRYKADQYLFFDNFLSDLGATETLTGHRNTASRVLFVIALIGLGLALAWFAPAWRTLALRSDVTTTPGPAAQLLGVLTGAGFVGIALTPWDRALDTHEFLVRATFGALCAYIACLTIVIAQNGWPRRWVVINLGYLTLLGAYSVSYLVGPDRDTLDGVRFQATAQKVVVYASILALAYQAIFVRAALRILAQAFDPAATKRSKNRDRSSTTELGLRPVRSRFLGPLRH
jgi:hypothetical protein